MNPSPTESPVADDSNNNNTSSSETSTTTTTTYTNVPPSKLTIKQLKSILTAADVTLPNTQQKKQVYVDLFLEHIGDVYKMRTETSTTSNVENDSDQEDATYAAASASEEPSSDATPASSEDATTTETTTTTTVTRSTPTRVRRRKERDDSDLDENRPNKRRRISTTSSTSNGSVTSSAVPRRTSVHVLPKSTFLSTRRGSMVGKPYTTRDLWTGRADILAGTPTDTDRRFSSSSTYVSSSLLEPTTTTTGGDDSVSRRRSFSVSSRRGDEEETTTTTTETTSDASGALNTSTTTTATSHHTPATLNRSSASTPVDEEFVKHFPTPRFSTGPLEDSTITEAFLHSDDLPQKSPVPDLSPSRTIDLERGPLMQFIAHLMKLIFWILIFWVVFTVVSRQKSVFDMDNALPFYGPSYCDSEKYCGTEAIPNFVAERCQPCPIHGYCCNGKLESCQEPFVRHRAQCVDPSKTSSPALHLATFIQELLSTRAGAYECNKAPTRGLPTDEIRDLLLEEYLHQQGITQSISPSDDTLRQFELTYSKVLDLIKDPVNGIMILNDHMESNIAVKSLKCAISDLAHDYKYPICAITFLILLVASIQVTYKRLQESKYLLEDKIILTLTRLRDVGRCQVQELKDSLIEDYGEEQFGDVWGNIESVVAEDERVQSLEDDEGNYLWEWIGDASAGTPAFVKAAPAAREALTRANRARVEPRDLTDDLVDAEGTPAVASSST